MSSEIVMGRFRHGLVEHGKDLGFTLNLMRMHWRLVERASGNISMPKVSLWHLGVHV